MRHSVALPALLLTIALLLVGSPLLADSTNAPATQPSDYESFSPGLGLFAFVVIMVLVVAFALLLGMGLAAGLIVSALIAALTAFGILSSAVVIGLIRRSPASGFRALFIQLGMVAGIPCGIGAMWLVARQSHIQWSTGVWLLVGSSCGLACGAAVALLFNFAWGGAAALLIRRYERRRSGQ